MPLPTPQASPTPPETTPASDTVPATQQPPTPAAQNTPATSPTTPATQSPQPSHPSSAFPYISSDGSHGWDGSQWVPIPGQKTVSNTPPPPPGVSPSDPNANDPSVQRAGKVYTIAQALAGGPRYSYAVDPTTGQTTKTAQPMSKTQVGLAIALEAIAGGFKGLAAGRGAGNLGAAGAAGVDEGVKIAQQRQQQDQVAQQQAQEQAKAKTSAFIGQAQAFEIGSRVVLNTKQSERYGVESLKDAVDANAPLLAGYQDAGAVQDGHVSQDTIQAGMKNGTYNVTSQIAIPDGFTNLNGRYEQTFSIVNTPRAKVPLTSAQAQAFGDAGLPGWRIYKDGKTKIADGFEVPGTVIANANAQLQAINLMKQEVNGVVDTLAKSTDKGNQALASSIPDFGKLLSDPDNGPPLLAALSKLQKYVSHSDWHGMTFAESLKQMAAPSMPDPRNPKQFIPNADAPAAQVIAGAFGNGDPQKGWAILQKSSEEATPEPIKNVDEAQSIATDPTSSPRDVKRAQAFLATDRQQKAQQAGAEERARQAAKPQTPTPASLTAPDALGFTPTITDPKEANKRFNGFKKNADDLAKTEQTYSQFTDTLNDINAGKDLTGAASVVALFNAIGLSGTALKGQGFRVNENVIHEHEQARGWLGAVQQKVLNVKAGDVITPQQIRDYASIAANARRNQYVAIANEAHNAGISANPFLPTGNGQKIDPSTAKIFFQLSGNDPNKARAAAAQKGWSF